MGFLICTEEFAGTITKEMLRSSKTELLVVPINGERLHRLVERPRRVRPRCVSRRRRRMPDPCNRRRKRLPCWSV